MDFVEFSKENILPLPGGRNVHQLGMALQAQTNRELQLELLQQKEQWDQLINTYTGDDPLDNYYKYISWIEQTYPKHGHEGNLIPLLEHCFTLFENDKRYTNDRRFCKLWIKYCDLQTNPLELYHMLRAKNICIGCTDFYKAWAYYHEAVGDFQAANNVFEDGKRNLAQPYDQLENAHQNLIMAAGQHMLYGPNESQLLEKRQALTSLHPYRSGRVSSIRVASSNGLVTAPSNSLSTARSNAMVQIHEDRPGDPIPVVTEAAPISIVAAAKRQEVPKENTLKAGPWTGTVPVKKRVIGSFGANVASGFTVHEDVMEVPKGIRLPKNYPKKTLEDYSEWEVAISYPDPPNPACIPKYPKDRVYGDPNTEYSIEEVMAERYLKKLPIRQEIIDDDEVEFVQETTLEPHSDLFNRSRGHQNEILQRTLEGQHFSTQLPAQQPVYRAAVNAISPPRPPIQREKQKILSTNRQMPVQRQSPVSKQSPATPKHSQLVMGQPMQSHPLSIQEQSPLTMHQSTAMQYQPTPALHESPAIQQSLQHPSSPMQQYPSSPMQQHPSSPMQQQPSSPVQHPAPYLLHKVSPMQYQQSPVQQQASPMLNQSSNKDSGLSAWPPSANFNLWQSPANKAPAAAFGIFEETLEENQPKGSAMKTAFKVLNVDELAETGSRGGMDVAAMAQATDSAKPMPLFSENSSSEDGFQQDISSDETLNTHVFKLNAMNVSTPQKEAPKKLSIIFEESKTCSGYGSSSSPSTGVIKSFNKTSQLSEISEEHNSYLAQNMKANAELRSRFLGDLMDFGPQPIDDGTVPTDQTTMQTSIFDFSLRQIPAPAAVAPVNFVPSDPFKSQLINQLLERVAFPGPHTQGYYEVDGIPRLCAKKEAIEIGGVRYVVDKQLGKGTFGTVYKAIDLANNEIVALKYQKPANRWEFYICREIQSRLSQHHLRDRFMDIPIAYFGDQASVIVSAYMPGGSLLDLANMYKQKVGKTMKECLVIFFCIQMLQVVQAMHKVQIIHADIKPDNFLIFITPDNSVALQLIDFGCSIDMSLFPVHASFRRRVTTEDFVCCEMLDGRPWNYHTDLFCLAATAHVLLFDTYIKLHKKDDLWSIQQRFPRYLKVDLWNMFFSSMLNQQTGPADAESTILLFEKALEGLNRDSSSALPSQIRYVVNLLKNR